MKTLITKIMIISTILSFFGCKDKSDPATWNDSKTSQWFNKGEWKNGWNVIADESINKKSMAVAYYKNKERWNSAFEFLKTSNLLTLEPKRYDIDGNNLYVLVSDYNTKEESALRYEAHRKYVDIQYVAGGKELIGLAPIAAKDSVLQAYDEAKDIEYMSVKEGRELPADPGRFFVFFPEDIHRPSLKIDTVAPVRKVVVKVRID